MKDLKTVRKIIKKLDEVETLFQALSQETKDELEREFEGGTKMYLIDRKSVV